MRGVLNQYGFKKVNAVWEPAMDFANRVTYDGPPSNHPFKQPQVIVRPPSPPPADTSTDVKVITAAMIKSFRLKCNESYLGRYLEGFKDGLIDSCTSIRA